MPISYQFGETYKDRFRYSNLATISDDENGGYLLVRKYFQGLVLKPRGYLIERYHKDLNLVEEFNYKLTGKQLIDGFVHQGLCISYFSRMILNKKSINIGCIQQH